MKILPLRGAKHAKNLAGAEWLLSASDAPFVVVLDKLSSEVVRLWERARRAAADGDLAAAQVVIDDLRGVLPKKDEQGFLASLGTEAIQVGALQRIYVAGLQEDDILDYLDDPKELARLKKQQKLTLERVAEAIPLDHVPDDLTGVIDQIRAVLAKD